MTLRWVKNQIKWKSDFKIGNRIFAIKMKEKEVSSKEMGYEREEEGRNDEEMVVNDLARERMPTHKSNER